MVIKAGKFGLFLACSGYPECENTRELETPEAGAEGEAIEEACENCGKPMAVKRGRFGQFLACTGYPGVQDDAEDHRHQAGDDRGEAGSDPRREVPEVRVEPGDQAGALRRVHGVQQLSRPASTSSRRPPASSARRTAATSSRRKSRRGKVFFGCANYPDCDFTLWNRPIAETCPECGAPFLVEKITKRHGRQLICNNEECCYVRSRSWRRQAALPDAVPVPTP